MVIYTKVMVMITAMYMVIGMGMLVFMFIDTVKAMFKK
jgi:hypothetical protein